MTVYFQPYNILENSTVTVSSENTDYPKYRLYDRDIGLLFKSQSYTGDFVIHIDQGSNIKSVDTLIIPAGHNLSGIHCYLQHSDDDSSWATASGGDFTPSDNDLITQTLSNAYTHRYWRLMFNISSFAVQIPEMILFNRFSLDNPLIGHTETNDRNFIRIESSSGKPYVYEKGDERLHYNMDFAKLSDTDKNNLVSLITDVQGGKPFYFYHWNDGWKYVELLRDPQFISTDLVNTPWRTTLEMREVLA